MGERVSLRRKLRPDLVHGPATSIAGLAGAAYLRYASVGVVSKERLVFFSRLAYTSVYATTKRPAHAAQGEDLHE